jgi:RimJ/RimL family protein N-acetyltransferase
VGANYIEYTCTHEAFKPDTGYPVRWLDVERDYDLVRAFWSKESLLDEWRSFKCMGYTYAAVIEDDAIVSLAAVWACSDSTWEVAAVSTWPSARSKGYAKSVVSFITQHILASGRLATCSTHATNIAMQRTAESVGFQQKRLLVSTSHQ